MKEEPFSPVGALSGVDFIGIDLVASESKSSAYAGLRSDSSLCCLGFWRSDDEILDTITKLRPRTVAIDAPLSLPKGMDCLEEECACQGLSPYKGRACERELARLGIPCYFTTKKSIIKEMVYRGMRLESELCRRGYEVMEVYPYASKVCLFGRSIPPKSKAIGLTFLRERLGAFIPDVGPLISKLNHDLCDALIASYTAYLHSRAETETVGDPDEGVIHIPVDIAPRR